MPRVKISTPRSLRAAATGPRVPPVGVAVGDQENGLGGVRARQERQRGQRGEEARGERSTIVVISPAEYRLPASGRKPPGNTDRAAVSAPDTGYTPGRPLHSQPSCRCTPSGCHRALPGPPWSSLTFVSFKTRTSPSRCLCDRNFKRGPHAALGTRGLGNLSTPPGAGTGAKPPISPNRDFDPSRNPPGVRQSWTFLCSAGETQPECIRSKNKLSLPVGRKRERLFLTGYLLLARVLDAAQQGLEGKFPQRATQEAKSHTVQTDECKLLSSCVLTVLKKTCTSPGVYKGEGFVLMSQLGVSTDRSIVHSFRYLKAPPVHPSCPPIKSDTPDHPIRFGLDLNPPVRSLLSNLKISSPLSRHFSDSLPPRAKLSPLIISSRSPASLHPIVKSPVGVCLSWHRPEEEISSARGEEGRAGGSHEEEEVEEEEEEEEEEAFWVWIPAAEYRPVELLTDGSCPR
ncbi:unnamed protein product [Pleuronectes platessa]|uniref:Uncharacterized protein n=1 Tax=Pleuronectes platessa TaxID=8262 RepID=A0A9N7TYI1_PLEPL|nr:unnamed protein product [Pleuronectes platessa]